MNARRIVCLALTAAVALGVATPSISNAAGPLKLKRTATQSGPLKETANGFKTKWILSTDRGAVGTATVRCRDGAEARCSVRSEFKEGKIVARGIVRSGRKETLPIVGGSGLFEDARGEFRVPPATSNPTFIYALERYG